MKWLMIFIFLSSQTFSTKAQTSNEYNYVDQTIQAIPAVETNSTDDIAAFIRRHFDTESKKVRAAYTWVTTNIKYDKDSIHRVILDDDRDQRVTFALRRRKGVCENFAAIFNDICIKIGLKSYMIDGYTKVNGPTNKQPHAWCAVMVDHNWFLFDPTWDAGFAMNGKPTNTNYFQILPVDFIQTHIPYDPLFQFLGNPVSYKEFSRGSNSRNESKPLFNYIDSLNSYEKSDSLTRYLSIFSRIEKCGWPQSLIDTKLKQIILETELIYQDVDMSNYNAAVADYNVAIENLNQFLIYRNSKFQPEKKDGDVKWIFQNIEKRITSANLKLDEINISKARLALDTGDLQKKLNDMMIKVKEQEIFFQNHLSASR